MQFIFHANLKKNNLC